MNIEIGSETYTTVCPSPLPPHQQQKKKLNTEYFSNYINEEQKGKRRIQRKIYKKMNEKAASQFFFSSFKAYTIEEAATLVRHDELPHPS